MMRRGPGVYTYRVMGYLPRRWTPLVRWLTRPAERSWTSFRAARELRESWDWHSPA
jgi:hypothetical protein